MRVVVVGATGNVGTSLLQALEGVDRIEEILGIARRRPRLSFPRTLWVEADVETDDLVPLFRRADAVVHLAWRIQPSRDLHALLRTNVGGSARVFRAAAQARVRTLVYASSVGAYSAGPKDRRVDESWPTDGIPTSFYGRHKAGVERQLDAFERENPDVRVVRLRPGLIFKRRAAEGAVQHRGRPAARRDEAGGDPVGAAGPGRRVRSSRPSGRRTSSRRGPVGSTWRWACR